MNSLIIALLFTFLISALIYKKKILYKSNIPSWLISVIFSFKTILIIGFIFYLNQTKQTDLIPDYYSYTHDSEQLSNVFYQNPKDYAKLIFNLKVNSQKEAKYLENTSLWFSSSDNYNDSKTFIKLQSIISIATFQNQWLQLVLASLLSTVSILLLIRTFSNKIFRQDLLFVFLSLGMPTLLVYGNIVMKEYFVIFGLSAMVYAIQGKGLRSIYFWIGLAFLLMFKIYVLISIICVLPIYLLFRSYKKKFHRIAIISIITSLFIMSLFMPFGRQVIRIITLKQYAFVNISTQGYYLSYNNLKEQYFVDLKDSSKIQIDNDGQVNIIDNILATRINNITYKKDVKVNLDNSKKYNLIMRVKYPTKSIIPPLFVDNSPLKLLSQIPCAIYRCLSLPTFDSPGGNYKYPVIFESLFINLFLIFSMFYGIYNKNKNFKDPLIISTSLFVLVLFILIGISTPVIGALVRYRIPAYIFVVILSFILIDPLWKRKSYSSLV